MDALEILTCHLITWAKFINLNQTHRLSSLQLIDRRITEMFNSSVSYGCLYVLGLAGLHFSPAWPASERTGECSGASYRQGQKCVSFGTMFRSVKEAETRNNQRIGLHFIHKKCYWILNTACVCRGPVSECAQPCLLLTTVLLRG